MESAGVGSLVDPQLAHYICPSWFVLYALAHLLAFTLSGLARQRFIVAFGFSVVLPVIDGLSVGSPWTNTIWALHSAIATFATGMLFFSPAVITRTRKIRESGARQRAPESPSASAAQRLPFIMGRAHTSTPGA